MKSVGSEHRACESPTGTRRIGRTIVTGGAGFVGSHLCEALVRAGHHVLCIDNLVTGRIENIAPLLIHPRFRFLRADVIDLPVIDGPVLRIYNLACPASPAKYQLDPIFTLRTSVLGATNLLDLAHRTGARILQASTSEVYGDPTVSPQVEEYAGSVKCWGPRACYDEGKRAAETLFHDYAMRRGVDTRVARIFNTYGPRMAPDDGRVVANFITQALNGNDLTIYGNGQQTRSFCHVDDLVAGLIALMESDLKQPAPVNLGNPAEITVAELAARIISMTEAPSRIVHRALPVDDPRRRRPDIARAKAWLGWEPKVDLEPGLRGTIAHFARAMLDEAEALFTPAEAI
ncbi:UDP-glucuronic acid decarboxylase family protein [Pararhodobacter sp. SW119]|uniref:UDP-glucuronic acid decarboxylase family protein n=1 Tax=Pararhodobacter sp. SW119 TaxID=2780075 RepID=UPI001ADF7453|nr:UDP-glucuronic acid decarboxylase family protein [Pararhodobacter sp. SW119]